MIGVLSHDFVYAFCSCWRYFVDCCMVSCLFVCPFFNTITTAGKIAFPHHQEKCPCRVIPPLSQPAAPCIVLKPRLVAHRTVEHLCQHSLHTLSSTPLTVLRIVVASTAHTIETTSRAKGGQSCVGVGAYVSKVDCVVNANIVLLLMPPLHPTSIHSSHSQPAAASVAVGVNPRRTTKDGFSDL